MGLTGQPSPEEEEKLIYIVGEIGSRSREAGLDWRVGFCGWEVGNVIGNISLVGMKKGI